MAQNLLTVGPKEFEAFARLHWDPKDAAFADSEEEFKKLEDLPLHLQYIERTINCGPRNVWVGQGFMIPGNSIVELHSHVGTMDNGWNRWADSTGKFTDNGEIFRARANFPTGDPPDWNAYCFLVASTSDRLRLMLRNTQIPNYGASVGSYGAYWDIGADEGGACQTCFNDEDNNNRGSFQQVLRYRSKANFYLLFRNLVDQNS